ncbi:hypothetical protein [Finegoldia magna]|uniref:hypothetical protein n=1 Tax=Finegoldia magna TaxID=1260 RepID=UPI002902642C|nr:hypothetical protein [Finegoldia magna]MDU1580168.1 hypothetical protein [Finegoldia magna]MDU1601235.1 hypothetical protein [Finegoldia magna]
MRIDRINTYDDNRFSQEALYQHGCYIVDGDVPVEIKIISQTEALIKGEEAFFDEVIEEFRFNAEHITNFYDESGKLIKKFKDVKVFKLDLDKIQPVQFFIDNDKLEAVKSFVNREEDVIIPVTICEDTYASLDGHTRLYLAYSLGFKYVYAYLSEIFCGFDYFFDEARKRNIYTAKDLTLLTHDDYTVKWDKFCDEYYMSRECE